MMPVKSATGMPIEQSNSPVRKINPATLRAQVGEVEEWFSGVTGRGGK
jgi:hypothetical protein